MIQPPNSQQFISGTMILDRMTDHSNTPIPDSKQVVLSAHAALFTLDEESRLLDACALKAQ